MDFEHNGVGIKLQSNGKFYAEIHGKLENAPSLDAMKRRIDAAARSAFQPLACLIEDKWGGQNLIEVTAHSIKAARKGARSYDDHPNFVLSNGEMRRRVMVNSPENLAAYQAVRDYDMETKRIAAERSTERKALWDKPVFVSADNFSQSKDAK